MLKTDHGNSEFENAINWRGIVNTSGDCKSMLHALICFGFNIFVDGKLNLLSSFTLISLIPCPCKTDVLHTIHYFQLQICPNLRAATFRGVLRRCDGILHVPRLPVRQNCGTKLL